MRLLHQCVDAAAATLRASSLSDARG